MTDEPNGFSKKIEKILDAALDRAKERKSAKDAVPDAPEKAESEAQSKAAGSQSDNRVDGGDKSPPADSTQSESPAPAPVVIHVDHPEKLRAHARIYFALVVLAVAAGVLWFGSTRRATNVPEGTVIMLLSVIPFFGAAWHHDRGLKALRDLADSLQRHNVQGRRPTQ